MKQIGVVIAVLVGLCSHSHAGNYQFKQIFTATSGQTISAFPALNDLGSVAFSPAARTIFVSDGTTSRTIASSSSTTVVADQNLFSALVAINNSGTVAFPGSTLQSGGGRGLITGNGTTASLVAELTETGGTFTSIKDIPSLNNSGRIAVEASTNASPLSHFSIFQIPAGGAPVETAVQGSVAAINDFGDVAYFDMSQFRFVFRDSQGIHTILNNTFVASVFDMNNQGKVIFHPTPTTLYVGDKNSVSPVNTSAFGVLGLGLSSSNGDPALAINDSGSIVFGAGMANGQGGYNTVIFTGPDPTINRLVGAGDVIAGKTLQQVLFGREGFNNRGQLAFYGRFTDGSQAIILATPVPEPSAFVLSLMALVSTARQLRRSTIRPRLH